MHNKGLPPKEQYPLQDHNEVIAVLAEVYPRTFFVNATMRQPLKNGILRDINTDIAKDPNSKLVFYNIDAALGYYTGHFRYQENCRAGTPRIDLNGNRAGTVTEAEALEASRRAAEGRAKNKEKWRAREELSAAAASTVVTAVQPFKTLTVDNTMTNEQLAASIVENAHSLQEVVDNAKLAAHLRKAFVHSTCVLLADEIRALDARFTKRARRNFRKGKHP